MQDIENGKIILFIEIDFKNFDQNLQNLVLLRDAAGFFKFLGGSKWLAAHICQFPQLQVEYIWTGLNVKLLAGCILLFWIGVILVTSKKKSA